MLERSRSLLYPPIEVLLEQTTSKFILISLAAKRARQINDYRAHLGEGLGTMVPVQIETDTTKALSIAFDEIAAGKIVPYFPEVEGAGDAVEDDIPE